MTAAQGVADLVREGVDHVLEYPVEGRRQLLVHGGRIMPMSWLSDPSPLIPANTILEGHSVACH